MKRGEVDDLIVFATIARARSFTRAAAALNLSSSALSHCIKTLETRLGVCLLARTTRSVSATPAGERLLLSVEPALKQLESGLADLGDWRGEASGSVKITASQYPIYAVLAPALPKFLRDHPKITVEIDVSNRLVDLVRDGFDAGIRFGEDVEQDMVAVRVGPDTRVIIVGSPNYLKTHPRPQSLADLDHHNCMNFRFSTSGGLSPWRFTRGGKEARARGNGQLVVNDGVLMADMILAGAGLGYMLEPHAAPYIASGQLIHVLDDWASPMKGLHIYYPSRQVTPALRALVDALKWNNPAPVAARTSTGTVLPIARELGSPSSSNPSKEKVARAKRGKTKVLAKQESWS